MTTSIIRQVHAKCQEKKCAKCGISKEAEKFRKKKSAKSGLTSWCKDCLSVQEKQYRQEHRLKQAKYYQDNKEGRKAQFRQYYQTRKEKILTKRKKYHQEHREERAAYNKQYKQNHKEEIAARLRIYFKTDRGKAVGRKGKHKYRALKLKAAYEDFSSIEVFERDGYRCQLCNRKTRPDFNQYHKLHPELDHIVPLSKGGEHSRRNTQCLCHLCNLQKHNTGVYDQLRIF